MLKVSQVEVNFNWRGTFNVFASARSSVYDRPFIMKEQWSISKEKLVNLEEGTILESEPTGLKVIREERSTCKVFIQYVKLILYVEFALLIGWACYSLWQTYRIESLEVTVGDLIGKPHRQILIGPNREHDRMKIDQLPDIRDASELLPMLENILQKNDETFGRAIEDLHAAEEDLIIAGKGATQKQMNSGAERYVRLDVTNNQATDSEQEFISGRVESSTESAFLAVTDAFAEDPQLFGPTEEITDASESTSDENGMSGESSARKNNVIEFNIPLIWSVFNTDIDLSDKSEEEKDSSAIDSNGQSSEEGRLDASVSKSADEDVRDSDENRERESFVRSVEGESSQESESKSQSNEKSLDTSKQLDVVGETLQILDKLFDGTDSSEERPTGWMAVKNEEDEGSVDQSVSATSDSVENSGDNDSYDKWINSESIESSTDTSASEERVWPSDSSEYGRWVRFMRELELDIDEDDTTDVPENNNERSTTWRSAEEWDHVDKLTENRHGHNFWDSWRGKYETADDDQYLDDIDEMKDSNESEEHSWIPAGTKESIEEPMSSVDSSFKAERNTPLVDSNRHMTPRSFYRPPFLDLESHYASEPEHTRDDSTEKSYDAKQPESLKNSPLNPRWNDEDEMVEEDSDYHDSNDYLAPCWGCEDEYQNSFIRQTVPETIQSNEDSGKTKDDSTSWKMSNVAGYNSFDQFPNAPISDEKMMDKSMEERWSWFDRPKSTDYIDNMNWDRVTDTSLGDITTTVTRTFIGFNADGFGLHECTMNIVRGNVSPIICKPMDSVIAVNDIGEKKSEEEGSPCDSDKNYRDRSDCMPYLNKESLHERSIEEKSEAAPTTEIMATFYDEDTSAETDLFRSDESINRPVDAAFWRYINGDFFRSEELKSTEDDQLDSESNMFPGQQKIETIGMTISDDGIRIWKGLNVEDHEFENQRDLIMKLLEMESHLDEIQSDYDEDTMNDVITPTISEVEHLTKLVDAFIPTYDFENDWLQFYKNQDSILGTTEDKLESYKSSGSDVNKEWEYIKPLNTKEDDSMADVHRKRRAAINGPYNPDESRINPVMQAVIRKLYDEAARDMQQVKTEQSMKDL